MHDNSKRWLANYLSGRRAHVNFKGIPSKIRPFRDGVPQGSVLSPTLFNLFLHDIPTPNSQDTKILSYAEDITITSTHAKHNTAATNVQHYLNTPQTWLTTNRLKVATGISTATLITTYKQEYNNLTPVTIYSTPIPYSLHQQGENPRSHMRQRSDIQRTHSRHQTKMHTKTGEL